MTWGWYRVRHRDIDPSGRKGPWTYSGTYCTTTSAGISNHSYWSGLSIRSSWVQRWESSDVPAVIQKTTVVKTRTARNNDQFTLRNSPIQWSLMAMDVLPPVHFHIFGNITT